MNTTISTLSPEQNAKKWATLHYVLHIVAAVFTLGTLTLIPVILNYMKRDEANGTFARSHMDYMIKSWWRYLIWTVICGAIYVIGGLITFTVGFFLLGWIFAIPWLIFIVRMVLGLMKLSDNRPIDA